MTTFQLQIDAALAAQFPEIRVVAFAVTNLARAAEAWENQPPNWHGYATAALQRQGISLENLAADPRLSGWRGAFAACGIKPAVARSSAEQLARRFLKGGWRGTGLPVVDAYCAVSAVHLAPLGAYDINRLGVGPVELRFGRSAFDRFEPLGGTTDAMPIHERVAVYAQGSDILCWCFNHRDSARFGLQAGTCSAVFVGEAVSLEQQLSLAEAMDRLRGLLIDAGALVGVSASADATSPQLELLTAPRA